MNKQLSTPLDAEEVVFWSGIDRHNETSSQKSLPEEFIAEKTGCTEGVPLFYTLNTS